MVAGPSKGPDRNQKPSTVTSTSTSTSMNTFYVDVDVLVHVDVLFEFNKGVKHTPENAKLLLPPRQSRGISQSIRPVRGIWAPSFPFDNRQFNI